MTPAPLPRAAFAFALVAAALLSALPVQAAPGAAYYAATPVAASAAARLVVRDLAWRCGPAGCTAAARGNSRPAIVCRSLVRQLGPLAAFRAGAQAFDAPALAACNAGA